MCIRLYGWGSSLISSGLEPSVCPIHIESSGWRLFTDGYLVIFGPITCGPRHPSFLGATACSHNTAVLVYAFSFTPHVARVAIGTAQAKRNIALSRFGIELLLQLKCNFHVSAHHVFGHAGNL